MLTDVPMYVNKNHYSEGLGSCIYFPRQVYRDASCRSLGDFIESAYISFVDAIRIDLPIPERVPLYTNLKPTRNRDNSCWFKL